MPWHVEKRGNQFCVIKDADGENEGCHDTREEADRHVAALYAIEPNYIADNAEFWDGGAAMKACETEADYKSVCALDRGASITSLTARFGLPHHPRPGAAPDRGGVAAAWAALAGGRTGTAMSGPGVAAARSHLAAHRRSMGMGEAAAEAEQGITFEAPEVAASFRVNAERRTISGLLVPWGKVSETVAFSKWRFVPGSLRWSDVSRIKLNMSHDRKEAVAVATRLQNQAEGLDGTFKVARGPEGDKALSLAEDRVFDGFSIEVGFDDEDGWRPDPSDGSVRLVDRAKLKGVALTAFPAFEDARVVSVAAMRDRGGEMAKDDDTTSTTLDAEQAEVTFETALTRLADKVNESHTRLTESLTQSIGESISEGVKTALEDIGNPQERGTVRAARYSVTREAPIYRFDGSGESLVKDAWNSATNRDEEAMERLRKFRKQTEEVLTLFQDQFSLNFAPQTTSTASQVIPPGYRPELYVADLFRERPYVAAASRGVIQNAAPFTVPVFGSVTGASADHVEGTNPSDGSLTFATKTVSPQAISGRIVLSRELVDSANPAIDQIALAEMRESYARQTEAKVYTLLNGTSGAGGTITSGFVPSGAQAATFASTGGTPYAAVALINGIRQQLALYPFRRFQAPTAVLMGSNATTILATANDSTGRPIFPAVGATNAPGTLQAGQAYDVDGRAFTPAWSNTGTAAGDSQIMILNRADLWVWESPLLTFRFEEKQGPANIELNIFGYFGTHLLRPVGLSGIRIT